jgi:hypothetical protein
MAYAAELRGFDEEAGLVAPAELAVGADVDRVALEHGGEDLGRHVGVVDQEGQAGVAVAVDVELRAGYADQGAVLDQPAVGLGDRAELF